MNGIAITMILALIALMLYLISELIDNFKKPKNDFRFGQRNRRWYDE